MEPAEKTLNGKPEYLFSPFVSLHMSNETPNFFGPTLSHANGAFSIVPAIAGHNEIWKFVAAGDGTSRWFIECEAAEAGHRLSHAHREVSLTQNKGNGELWTIIEIA